MPSVVMLSAVMGRVILKSFINAECSYAEFSCVSSCYADKLCIIVLGVVMLICCALLC